MFARSFVEVQKQQAAFKDDLASECVKQLQFVNVSNSSFLRARSYFSTKDPLKKKKKKTWQAALYYCHQ